VRGAPQQQARHTRDDYPTPDAEISALLDVLDRRVQPCDAGHRYLRVLEPSAGEGRVLQAVREAYHPDVTTAVELNQAYARVLAGRFHVVFCPEEFCWWAARVWRQGLRWELCVGNPPFGMSALFVEWCWHLLAPGGTLAFLLPLGFTAGVERFRINQLFPVTGLATLARRASYTGDGQTDFANYAWHVWTKARSGEQRPTQWVETVW
jgi:hypothetical protein